MLLYIFPVFKSLKNGQFWKNRFLKIVFPFSKIFDKAKNGDNSLIVSFNLRASVKTNRFKLQISVLRFLRVFFLPKSTEYDVTVTLFAATLPEPRKNHVGSTCVIDQEKGIQNMGAISTFTFELSKHRWRGGGSPYGAWVNPRPFSVFRHLRQWRGGGWVGPPWRFETKRRRA